MRLRPIRSRSRATAGPAPTPGTSGVGVGGGIDGRVIFVPRRRFKAGPMLNEPVIERLTRDEWVGILGAIAASFSMGMALGLWWS